MLGLAPSIAKVVEELLHRLVCDQAAMGAARLGPEVVHLFSVACAHSTMDMMIDDHLNAMHLSIWAYLI